MRIGTLFSGIGAPEQGAKRVYGDNLEMVFACEYDRFARQSFEANYEIDPLHFHKDVREMDGTQYQGKVDILIGGSPCQAFSIAGLRNGTDDERGQLIYQYIRIVDEVKAPVIVYENVKGMLSIGGGRTIKEFVQALRDIGYYCHYEVVNTKNYGVPQNRERIFLVGFLDHEAYHRFSFAPKQKLWKRLKDVLEDDVDEKYYLKDSVIAQFIEKTERAKREGNGFAFKPSIGENIAYSITTKAGGRVDDNFIDVIGLLDCKGTDQIRRVYGVDGVATTLTTMQGGNQEPKIQIPSATKCGYELAESGDSINLSVPNSTTRRGRVGKQVAQTLDTQCNQAVVQQRIRKLTPRECLRLQDFPNDFIQVDKEYVKSLFDILNFDIKSEVIIKEELWEMLKNIISQDVVLSDVIENQLHSGIALCTISDLKNMVMPIMSLNTRTDQKKNASIVIASLEKGSRECAYDIITLKDVMEMQHGSMNNQVKQVSVRMDIGRMDTQKSKQTMGINIDVELMLHLKLEENWTKEKLYIILTSIRQMMTNLTYGCLNLNLSMLVHMELSKDVERNCSKEDSLSLRMGNINFVSDSQMYKQAGNSMSCNILEMIFRQIEKTKEKPSDTLF
jgi:DNA (cytosine-5)-methyltransferase 1